MANSTNKLDGAIIKRFEDLSMQDAGSPDRKASRASVNVASEEGNEDVLWRKGSQVGLALILLFLGTQPGLIDKP